MKKSTMSWVMELEALVMICVWCGKQHWYCHNQMTKKWDDAFHETFPNLYTFFEWLCIEADQNTGAMAPIAKILSERMYSAKGAGTEQDLIQCNIRHKLHTLLESKGGDIWQEHIKFHKELLAEIGEETSDKEEVKPSETKHTTDDRTIIRLQHNWARGWLSHTRTGADRVKHIYKQSSRQATKCCEGMALKDCIVFSGETVWHTNYSTMQ